MSTDRVRYYEGQLLRADDLADEQAYRLCARRRHALAMHGWGIVHGLGLEATPEGIVLRPGLAIDGYGRELIVPAPVPLSWDDLFKRFDSSLPAVDIWLVYALLPLAAPPHGGDACDEGRCDRWYEQARLRLYAADLDVLVDPRRPPGVAPGPIDPRLAAAPPDAAPAWPVYLGRVRQVQTGPDNKLSGRVLRSARPYAALVGESVRAPLREPEPPPEAGATPIAQSTASIATEQAPPPAPCARVQVGAERLGDNRRFAVELPNQEGIWAEQLALGRLGNLTLRGPTTLRREPAQLNALTGELFRPGSRWPFKAGDLNDLERLAERLSHPETPLWYFIRRQLSTNTQDKLDAYTGCDSEPAQLCRALIKDLNQALILGPLVDYLFIAGRTWPFSAGDLQDPSGLVQGLIRGKTRLIGGVEPFYKWLYQKLSSTTKGKLAACEPDKADSESPLDDIVADLNTLLGQFDAGLPGDLHIGRAGPEFTRADLSRPAALLCRLQLGANQLAAALRDRLDSDVRQQLAVYRPPDEPPATLLDAIVDTLNGMLGEDLVSQYGQSITLDDTTRRVLATLPAPWASRLILQRAFAL